MRWIALVAASFWLVLPATSSAKVVHGGSFESVWKGESVVICRNTYSLQYGFFLLGCGNDRGQLAIIGPRSVTLTTDDGSFNLPPEAQRLYAGDYWNSGHLQCRVYTYGRVRCYALTTSTHGFEMARTYDMPVRYKPVVATPAQ